MNGSMTAREFYRTSSITASSLSRSPSTNYDPRAVSPSPSTQYSRHRPSLPPPPNSPNSARPLNAAEEKARLRAQYEAEEAEAAGAGGPVPSGSLDPYYSGVDYMPPPPETPPNETTVLSRDPTIKQGKQRASNNTTPPPLLPKPPSNYIQETQAEDERIRTQLDENDTSALLTEDERSQSPFQYALDIRPFSPFEAELSFSNIIVRDSDPVPPLPPKIPISHF
jgi:hypothetical protein